MTTEYGLFSDEGCVERQLWSRDEAETALAERYSAEDGLTVEDLCPDHDDEPREGCQGCQVACEDCEATDEEDCTCEAAR